MKVPQICSLIFCCIFSCAQAQHCEYDQSYLLLLDIQHNGNTIDGLSVTLRDSLSNQRSDNCKNVKDKSFDKLHKAGRLEQRFPFAREKYLLIDYSYNLDCWNQIVIRDQDGDENGGYFEGRVIAIDKKNFQLLCVDYWDVIRPMKVELKQQ